VPGDVFALTEANHYFAKGEVGLDEHASHEKAIIGSNTMQFISILKLYRILDPGFRHSSRRLGPGVHDIPALPRQAFPLPIEIERIDDIIDVREFTQLFGEQVKGLALPLNLRSQPFAGDLAHCQIRLCCAPGYITWSHPLD
jgi:hypothetical protein